MTIPYQPRNVPLHSLNSLLTNVAIYQLDLVRNYNNAVKTAETRGREEGEKKAKIESTRKMLTKGLDIADIVEFTGLSLEEVENLKQR